MGKSLKRLTSLVTTAILTASLICGDIRVSPQIEVQAATSYTNEYGLAKETKNGVILHAFTWRFNTIKDKMKEIADSGYSAIQVSPIQKCSTSPGQNVWEWVFTYRPTGYSIGNHIVGTEEEFKEMCREADKYGIKIIVDVVANHLIRDSETDPNLKDNNAYFHNAGVIDGGDYGSNRWKVTHGDLAVDLPDLNTSNKDVQNYIIKFLNNCIDDGADGFRFDMTKHIELPNEDGGSDFWPTILEAIYKKKSDAFVYGEVLQDATAKYGEYNKLLFTGADSYSRNLRDRVITNNNIGNVNDILNYCSDGADASRLVTYIETHDHFANDTGGTPNINGGTRYFNNWQMEKGYTIVASRQKGTPLFYDRPAFTGMVDRSAKWPGTYGLGGPMGVSQNMWKDAEVVATNKFHNAMIGEQEYIEAINNNTLLIKRGNKGVAVINMDGGADVNVKVGLPDGEYKDLGTSGGTFKVSGGMLTGKVQSGKTAFIYKEPVIVKEPTATISQEGGSFIDSLTLTLGYTNATSGTYSIDGGAKKSYSNGEKITIGKDKEIGETVKVTLTATDGTKTSDPVTYTFKKKDPNERNIAYMEKPSSWPNAYAYVYNDDPTAATVKENAKWPGLPMTKGDDGIYYYEMPEDYSNARIIFTDGTNEGNKYPTGIDTPGLTVEGSMIYKDGSWEPYDNPNEKPTVSISKDGGDFVDKLTLTLGYTNATSAVYYINDVKKGTYTNGEKITIGEDSKVGDTITVKLVATNGNNKAEEEYKFTKVKGNEELLLDSITTNLESPQLEGSTIKITANASGGVGDLLYRFEIDGEVVQGYSNKNTYTWKPDSKGDYNIKVTVKDEEENKDYDSITYTIKKKSSDLSIDSFSVSPKSVKVGETVKLSASASGGSGTVQYKFVAKKGSQETVIKDYSTTKTATWTPSAVGDYELLVYVKDSDGNSDSDSANCTVEESNEDVVITTDKASPQVTGTSIKITAKANDAKEYRFSIYESNSGWSTLREYGTSNTVTWTPKSSGDYIIWVEVKDSKGNVTHGEMKYTVKGKTSRVEETNTNIKYTGSWKTVSGNKYSGETIKTTNQGGAKAEFTFTGTSISLIGPKDSTRGIAKVTIDGTVYTVDMYSSTSQPRVYMFQKKGLSSEKHTIAIEYTGLSMTSDANATMGFDGVDIIDGNICELPGKRIEETNENITYTGAWKTSNNAAHSGGSCKALNGNGSATFKFTGTGIRILAPTNVDKGLAKVTIDGEYKLVSMYTPNYKARNVVYEVNNLPVGTHTIKIEYTGLTSSGSTGAAIVIDAVDIIEGDIVRTEIKQTTKRIEEDNSKISYSGKWNVLEYKDYSQGKALGTNTKGSKATFKFTGTGISIIAAKKSNRGIAKVTIDGKVYSVDMYSNKFIPRTYVYSDKSLSSGTHTITIEYTGNANSSATGNTISIDGFDIINGDII